MGFGCANWVILSPVILVMRDTRVIHVYVVCFLVSFYDAICNVLLLGAIVDLHSCRVGVGRHITDVRGRMIIGESVARGGPWCKPKKSCFLTITSRHS